jgi:hypothetical protein
VVDAGIELGCGAAVFKSVKDENAGFAAGVESGWDSRFSG